MIGAPRLFATVIGGGFTTTLPAMYHAVPGQSGGRRTYCCVDPDNGNAAADYESLRDPDAGLTIEPVFATSLLQQAKSVAAGERGTPLEEVLKELSLT